MYPIFIFVEDLQEYLTKKRSVSGNIIRKHSKRLIDLGDISFPLALKNWSHLLSPTNNQKTIFDYLFPNQPLNQQCESLLKASLDWSLKISRFEIKDNDVHLYLQRHYVIDLCMKQVLKENVNYGLEHKYFQTKINFTIDQTLGDITKINLTQLRLILIQNVASNIVNSLTSNITEGEYNIKILINSNEKNINNIICGFVLNEGGLKDIKTTASELYKKRALDMQLMAQHKYGIQLKPSWSEYFQKLGKASVVIEMLQNKTHKSTKITLNNLQTTNKGPSFIFYNCARISALLKHFNEKVMNKTYPDIPPVDEIDFTLLNQPEEWEIVFVYLLQFPAVIKNCVCDIEEGILNIHYLVTFLSNLSSVFSIYYRRVKILTSEKEHLLPALYAKIYLIRATQQVFHTSLHLLDIEPVKEM